MIINYLINVYYFAVHLSRKTSVLVFVRTLFLLIAHNLSSSKYVGLTIYQSKHCYERVRLFLHHVTQNPLSARRATQLYQVRSSMT